MMDHVIHVHVIDKIAHVVGDPLYVCGNSDYTVKFDFDVEWAGHETKTARFVKNNKEYIDVVFTGDQCAMPILENTPSVRIGVYAGNLCTTTAAVVNAQRSILCGSGAPADPHPDVYAQVMQKMDDIYDALPSEEVLTEIRTSRESAEEAAKKAESAVKNKADVVVDTMTGSVCTTNVSVDAPLQRLVLYGKTTQDGTPAPDAPVPMVNAGSEGSIRVFAKPTDADDSSAKSIIVETPNGLLGIPVTGGGNYTDENGAQWICDEIDLERGVYVQRIQKCEKFSLSNTYTNTMMYSCYPEKVLKGANDGVGMCNVTNVYKYNVNDYVHFFISANKDAVNVHVPVNYDNTANPIVVYAALETPIETPIPADNLPDYRLLHTIKPNTTVYNDAGAGMKVDYAADTKAYIDQKIAAIAAAVL